MTYAATMAFPLLEADVLLAEPDTWQLLAPYLPFIGAPDLGGPKRSGEWMLAGSSYAGPQALASWAPEVSIGQSRKRLRVYGPREWKHHKLSAAHPVESVTMDWRAAWGGAGIADNPLGCGVRVATDNVVVPCIEYPDHPWENPDSFIPSACTLPLDIANPQRQTFAGTYDASYRERFFLGVPDDFDQQFFNRAPFDQRILSMWQGDECFMLRHWHPEIPCIQGRLPGLRVALHVSLRGEGLQRVNMGLSTIWLFPNDLLGVLVFEGQVPSQTLTGSEIERVIAGVERVNTVEHTVEHYERLWQMRTEITPKAAALAMDDTNLCPQGVVTRFAALDNVSITSTPNPALDSITDRMACQWESASQQIAALKSGADQSSDAATASGAGTAHTLSPLLEDMQTLFRGLSAQANQNALDLRGKKTHEIIEAVEKFRSDQTQELNELRAEYKLLQKKFETDAHTPASLNFLDSPDAVNFPQDRSTIAPLMTRVLKERDHCNPVNINASEIKELFAQLDPEAMRQGWDRLDALIEENLARGESVDEMAQARRSMAKFRQQVAAMGDDEADGARRLVEHTKAYASMVGGMELPRQPLSGEDWDDYTRRLMKDSKSPQFEPLKESDLHHPDLFCGPGLSLNKRTLGHWCLRGLDLRGAVFDNMTFIRCDFRDCDLSGSIWNDCTLIGCDLSGVKLDTAQIQKSRIQWCCLNEVSGANSRWESNQFFWGYAKQSDWQFSHWTANTITETDYTNSNWNSSTLIRQIMLKVSFGVTQMVGCQVQRSAWVDCRLTESVFDSCALQACYIGGFDLPKSWCNASLMHISFNGAKMSNGDWRDARLDSVDFSNAMLHNCDFSNVKASNVRALSADLSGCSFQGARIINCVFIDSILYDVNFDHAICEQCAFGLAKQNKGTSFTGANLLSSTFDPKPKQSTHT